VEAGSLCFVFMSSDKHLDWSWSLDGKLIGVMVMLDLSKSIHVRNPNPLDVIQSSLSKVRQNTKLYKYPDADQCKMLSFHPNLKPRRDLNWFKFSGRELPDRLYHLLPAHSLHNICPRFHSSGGMFNGYLATLHRQTPVKQLH